MTFAVFSLVLEEVCLFLAEQSLINACGAASSLTRQIFVTVSYRLEPAPASKLTDLALLLQREHRRTRHLELESA
jgi:hypothetical protein